MEVLSSTTISVRDTCAARNIELRVVPIFSLDHGLVEGMNAVTGNIKGYVPRLGGRQVRCNGPSSLCQTTGRGSRSTNNRLLPNLKFSPIAPTRTCNQHKAHNTRHWKDRCQQQRWTFKWHMLNSNAWMGMNTFYLTPINGSWHLTGNFYPGTKGGHFQEQDSWYKSIGATWTSIQGRKEDGTKVVSTTTGKLVVTAILTNWRR